MSSDTDKTDWAAMTVPQFHEALEAISREHGRAENLRHFMEAAYCSLAKITAPDAKRADALEARYVAVVRAYGHKLEIMARMAQVMARLTLAVAQYRGDFLGEAYAKSGLANDRRKQFCSSYGVAEAEVQKILQQQDVTARLSKGRPIEFLDRACGAGTLVIAAAARLESMGFEPRRTLFATLITNDPLAYQMAFLQMTLKGIPALCICADTLTGQEFDRACTTAAIDQRQWLAARGEHSPPLLGQCAPGHAAPSDGASPKPGEPAAPRKHLQKATSPTRASRTRSRRTRPH